MIFFAYLVAIGLYVLIAAFFMIYIPFTAKQRRDRITTFFVGLTICVLAPGSWIYKEERRMSRTRNDGPFPHCPPMAPGIRAVFSIALLLALVVWVPAIEAKQTEEQRREHCLNNPCPGDIQPKYDWAKEQRFKRGGRWFIGPKQYFSTHKGAFYWPSKHPAYAGGEYPEKGMKFSDIAIEFFIEAKQQIDEMQEFINREQVRLGVAKRDQLRPHLERIELKPSVSGPTAFYVAQNLKTPSGQQPILSCNHRDPAYGCGSHFAWKNGLLVTIRFNQRHATDWPEIYSEIIRVLTLVEEK